MDANTGLARRLAEVCQALQEESGSVDTMDLAVQLAVQVVPAADEASISLVDRKQCFGTRAITSDHADRINRIQQEAGFGPLGDDLWEEEVVTSSNLADETRWGEWGPRLSQELGFGSFLGFRMHAGKGRLGALSVFSRRPNAFTHADIEAGTSLAAHVAVAIVVAQQDEYKEIAMDSRSVIGQATGMVMERYGVDAVRAFAVLKRISQDSNVKLQQVAADLIRTRLLP